MATEILVNDGGTPARILPFVAAATGSAGDPVILDTTGKTAACIAGYAIAGVLLTDVAAVGDIASVVMGHGCIVNVNVKSDVAIGNVLQSGTARLDGAANGANAGDGVEAVGIALETPGAEQPALCLLF